MKKSAGDFNVALYLTAEEAKEICRLGQGEKCCPFLVCGADGFECCRKVSPINATIFHRIGKGTMNAKGKECDWEKTALKAMEV